MKEDTPKNTNYREAYQLSKAIEEFRKGTRPIAFIFDPLIEPFIDRNQKVFDDLAERLKQLCSDHCHCHENGQPKTITVTVPVFDKHVKMPPQKKTKLDYKSASHEQQYEKGWKELMDTACELIL